MSYQYHEDKLNVYIAHEDLRAKAVELIHSINKITGYHGENVNIIATDPAFQFSNGSSIFFNNPPAAGTSITITGAAGGGGVSSGTYNYPYTGTSFPANGTTTYFPQTTAWTSVSSPVPSIYGPVKADIPPAKEHFEKMVLSSIQMLNEAYLLGREHGKQEGIKEGSDQILRTIDHITDVEILTYQDEAQEKLASAP